MSDPREATITDPEHLIGMVDRAVLANSAGEPTRADQLLGEVLDRVECATRADGVIPGALVTVAGRARVTLALTRFETGRRSEAFTLLDEADRLAERTGADTVRVLAAIQRAGLQGRLGNWAAALASLQTIGDAASTVSPRAAVAVAINAGLARQFLGDVVGSAADLERAERLAIEHGIDDLAAAAVHNRGRLEFVRGDLGRALDLMERASRLAGVRVTQSDLDRARVLLEAGLLDAADELLEGCRDDAENENLVHDLGEITMERARLALLVGDHALARERAVLAAHAFAQHQESAWRTQAVLLTIEADVAAGHSSPELARRADALADGPAAASGVGAAATLLAAEAHAHLGALDAARTRLAVVRGRRLSLPDRLHRDLARVTIAAASGDPATVRRHVRSAVADLGRELGRRSGLDARTAMALHGSRLGALDVDLALADGSPAAVFDACERWRGLSHRLPSVTPSEDQELAAQLTELRQTQLDLREGRGEPAELQQRITSLERDIRRRDWGTSDSGGAVATSTASRPTTTSVIRRRLGTRGSTGMVALFVHRDRLRAVTVVPGDQWVTDLAPAEQVTVLAQRLSTDLRSLGRAAEPRLADMIRSASNRTAAELDALIEPALPGTDRVVVIPSGLLASVPWRLLPRLADRVVTVSPSATFWAGDTSTDTDTRDDSRDDSAREAPRAADPVTAIAGPGLRRAPEEVAAVASAWSPTPVTSAADAAGSVLIDALHHSTVVHVAAHGTHHEQSPLFSSVLLADGPVFAHEFQRVGIGAHHVVLSACDVGRVRIRPGDEPLGLTAALLSCGVSSVVAAVAPVRDEAAAAAMAAYHQELSAGSDAAQALATIAAEHPESRLFCSYGRDWAASSSSRFARARG